MKVKQMLACGNPGGNKCAGTWTTFATGVMALSVSFFEPLAAGSQKASLAVCFCSSAVQTLRGLTCLGSSLLFGVSGTQCGSHSWGSTL